MNDPALLDLVRTLVAEVQRIRVIAEGRSGREPDVASATLLGEIFRHVGDAIFTSGDLIEHSGLDAAQGLREALAATLRPVNARRIGKWLRSIEGQALGGVTVQRAGEGRDGIEWQILQV